MAQTLLINSGVEAAEHNNTAMRTGYAVAF